jgi:GTP-binding protein EngB required for normal cell division
MNTRRPATADREERRNRRRRPGSAAADEQRKDADQSAESVDQAIETALARPAGEQPDEARPVGVGTWVGPPSATMVAASRAWSGASTAEPSAPAADADADADADAGAPETDGGAAGPASDPGAPGVDPGAGAEADLGAGAGPSAEADAGSSEADVKGGHADAGDAEADGERAEADGARAEAGSAGEVGGSDAAVAEAADSAVQAPVAAPEIRAVGATSGPDARRLPVRAAAAPSTAPRTTTPGAGAGAGSQVRRAEPPQQETIAGLSGRLMALARMIQIGSARSGRDGFDKKLLNDAEDVLARAGDRMRLSSGHTVVALAGGTGSGKSSLFNKIAGADFSAVGVTRPVTLDAHACVWGEAGSGAILDWLKIPGRARYSRESALGSGEDALAGLVLLDLPDHDSVMNHAGALVDRLVSMADVMIWVLDPQKYADAAVHRRFLVPMAGHSDVLAVVLNQIDLVDPEQVDDCIADLRRLLDSENLQDVSILVTSAVTGEGLDDLRTLLADGVAARRAAAARISADLDAVVARFEPYAGDVDAPVGPVPVTSKSRLAERFAAAAGITAVADALRSARELRAADFVGWPVAWFVQRLSGRNPLRKVRLGMLWNDLRSVTAGPAGAQQAEIDNALTDLGSELAEPLPLPWSHTVKAAVRSQAEQVPAALGAAIGDVLPDEDSVVWWWRFAGVWQGLLLGAAAVGVAWMALILAFGVFHAASGLPAVLTDTGALPWIAVLAVVALVLGATTASICMRLVVGTAEHDNSQVTAAMKDRVAGVANEMVIVPAEQELAELQRYREENRIAERGLRRPSN